ncbi:MAG: hypothetical protein PUP93_00170 [Rhizonema sp. NSF051]|nr:hypothetical protein [Rhizonema sp. NSF051]
MFLLTDVKALIAAIASSVITAAQTSILMLDCVTTGNGTATSSPCARSKLAYVPRKEIFEIKMRSQRMFFKGFKPDRIVPR